MSPSSVQKEFETGVQLHQQGKLDEAAAIYRKVLAALPNHADALHLSGVIDSQQDRHEEGIEKIERALKMNTHDSAYHNNLSKILLEVGKKKNDPSLYKKAQLHAEKAIALTPDHVKARNNLGNAFEAQRDYDKAVLYYREALEKEPDNAEILNNLGAVLFQQGKTDEAAPFLIRAIDADPNEVSAHRNMTFLLMQKAPIQLWGQLCQQFLQTPILRQKHAYELFVKYGIHAWSVEDMKSLDQILQLCRLQKEHGEKAPDQDIKSMQAFAQFLEKLMAWRLAHPIPAAPEGSEQMVLIGESHSLSYANLNVEIGGKTYRTYAHIVPGCKAFHLGSDGMNQFIAHFHATLNRFAPHTKTFLLFGEIDCRVDGGILDHWRKKDGDLKEIVQKTVASYVRKTTEAAAQRKLDLTYVNVPAPSVEDLRAVGQTVSAEDEANLILTVRLFNEALREEAKKANLPVVDVYALTTTPEGVSNKRFHIDTHHLNPDAIIEALSSA